jgi:glycerol-3-phosphate dehydrogenase (NAD(P)+)
MAITVLGTGAMATVCAELLCSNHHSVRMWSPHPATIDRLTINRNQDKLLPGGAIPPAAVLTADDTGVFDGADLIVSAIPVQYTRTVWQRLVPHLQADARVVSVSKGVELSTLLRPTEVLADVISTAGKSATLAVMSGPNIAVELARHCPAMAVAASADCDLAVAVQQTFSTPWFRVYTNPDLVGVELAGAMKNIIALAAGMLDGMDSGNNAKAALVTRGLVEITRLAVKLGANPATFMGLAGLGDLITTCVSPEGRNRRVGDAVGRGKKLEQVLAELGSVAEGVPTTQAVRDLAHKHGVEMPITEMLYAILFQGQDVRRALNQLMTRAYKGEMD